MRRSIAPAFTSFALALAAAELTFGCVTTDNKTQLTVVLTSEAAIPSQVNMLQVQVQSHGSTAGPYVYDLYRDTNGYFPQTLALIPQDEGSVSQPVSVSVAAMLQPHDASGNATGQPAGQVLRTAVASYVEGHTLLLPMPLRMACLKTTCDGAGESCIGGQCVSATVGSLVDFQPQYVFPSTGACFDDAKCLGSPVPAVPADDCTFALPPGTSASSGVPNVNASIEWDASPGLVIVLDADDANEGWTPVAGDPTRGRLSKGVCAALKRQAKVSQAKGLYLSPGCPAKSRLRPACDSRLNIGVPL